MNPGTKTFGCAPFFGLAFFLLTLRAAEIQGANPNLAFAGLAVGIVVGFWFPRGKISLRFIGFVVGSLLGLQLIRCSTCDGSYVLLPLLGACFFGLVGWFVQVMTPQLRATNRG